MAPVNINLAYPTNVTRMPRKKAQPRRVARTPSPTASAVAAAAAAVVASATASAAAASSQRRQRAAVLRCGSYAAGRGLYQAQFLALGAPGAPEPFSDVLKKMKFVKQEMGGTTKVTGMITALDRIRAFLSEGAEPHADKAQLLDDAYRRVRRLYKNLQLYGDEDSFADGYVDAENLLERAHDCAVDVVCHAYKIRTDAAKRIQEAWMWSRYNPDGPIFRKKIGPTAARLGMRP